MTTKMWCVLAVGAFFLGGCGNGAIEPSSMAGMGGTAGLAGLGGSGGFAGQQAGGTGGGAGAGATAGGDPPVPTLDGGALDPRPLPDAGSTLEMPCDYEMEDVALAADLVIGAGSVVHVCAGVTFTAAKDVKIDVLGDLIVDGTAAAPVRFLGAAAQPRAWHGLVVESGGILTLSHAKIGGAIYGIYTLPGSNFAVDATELGTSFKTAVLQSNGTITNSKFVASVPPTIAITDGVTIDDPNGSLTIIDASPTITNCKFDGASAFTDLIRVGGQSSPTFDHVHVHAAHCGFHTSGGTNTSMHVTNAIFENLSYGIMAYATKPIVEDSVFRMNGNDIGICTGATTANTPVLMNNNYASGQPVVDASCFMINTADPSPAASANPAAGPSGL